MFPTGSYTVSTAPFPGSWAAPFRGPHPRQAGSLSSMRLGLTCEIDSHGHDDNNDPHDDEGDTEQPGQAAQPPGAVQVPLLHTTSGLQREGGRDLRKAVPSRRGWGHPLPWPPEPTQPPLQPLFQHPPWGWEAGFSCRTGSHPLWERPAEPAPGWKQNQAVQGTCSEDSEWAGWRVA